MKKTIVFFVITMLSLLILTSCSRNENEEYETPEGDLIEINGDVYMELEFYEPIEVPENPYVENEIEEPHIDDEIEMVVLLPIIGNWLWDGPYVLQYSFDEDGTGNRGHLSQSNEEYAAEMKVFNWELNDNILTLNFHDGEVEVVNIEVNQFQMTLDTYYIFYRIMHFEENILGEWSLNGNLLVFNENNTGFNQERNEDFVWQVTTNQVLIIRYDVQNVELFEYHINDNILTLYSQRAVGVSFTYERN